MLNIKQVFSWGKFIFLFIWITYLSVCIQNRIEMLHESQTNLNEINFHWLKGCIEEINRKI